MDNETAHCCFVYNIFMYNCCTHCSSRIWNPTLWPRLSPLSSATRSATYSCNKPVLPNCNAMLAHTGALLQPQWHWFAQAKARITDTLTIAWFDFTVDYCAWHKRFYCIVQYCFRNKCMHDSTADAGHSHISQAYKSARKVQSFFESL